LHEATVHAPIAQPAVPLATAHALPHPPQCEGSVSVETSQPFVSTRSQFPKPASQTTAHVLAKHAGVLFGRVGHALSHAPQCAADVVSAVSQPFAAFPSQLPSPEEQTLILQTPASHFGVEPASAHKLPQLPQCSVVVAVSVSHPLL
jgi:hypothetical protein